MNNKVPQVTYIYNRYKKASPTIAASIEIRITYDKKQKYISTGISVYSNQWKGNRVINRPDAIQLNNILDSLLIETRVRTKVYLCHAFKTWSKGTKNFGHNKALA